MRGKVYVLIMIVISFVAKSQDNQYSQFFANKIYLNPAFTGTEVCPRVILGFRDQWPGMQGEYVSYTASYDQTINKVGFGVLFNSDDAGRGILKTNNVSLIASPKVRINHEWTASFALEGGIVSKRLDNSTLIYPNQLSSTGLNGNPQEITEDKGVLNTDFSVGALFYSSYLYFGYSMHHVMGPNISFADNPDGVLYRRHTSHVGVNIDLPAPPHERRLGKAPRISPQIIFQQQGPARELNLGLYYTKNKFTSGIWYRNEDSVILLMGVQSRKFSFGFSYDITISKLSNNTFGALELSTAYKFNCRFKKPGIPKAECPSF